MERFDALSDTAEAFSGEFDEFNDPDTSANDIGSSAELGGAHGDAATYDDLDDAQVINLTGQSDTAMVAGTTENGTAENPAGSGSAGQQIMSVRRDPAATDQIRGLVRSGQSHGAVLASTFHSPRRDGVTNRGSAPLVQTSQTGISLSANMILFFILGCILGVMLVNRLES